MDFEIFQYINQGLFWIVEIVILIACAILAYKQRSIPSMMMLIGIIISMFFGIARTVVFALKIPDFDIDKMVMASSIVGILQTLGYGLFGLGLLLLANRYKKQLG